MKLLHVAPAFYPSTYFGGPIFSTYALCNALAALPEVELRVLTTDTAGPKASDRVLVSSFPMYSETGYEVYYARRELGTSVSPKLLVSLLDMVSWADAVLLTGTYSFPTIPTLITCRFLDKPLVWSPRGALQASHEWAAARRPRLKRVWERICQRVRPRRCVLHVTAAAEEKASLARLPDFATRIISNGVEVPGELPPRVWRPDGQLRIMFISRIDPKKGLDVLLRAMGLIPDATLDVYGDGDATYVRTMKQLAFTLGLASRVRFHGHVEGNAKRDSFLNADIFVLPTHSENFGMVVAEALAHGVPVVVSRGAPWSDVESRGCGRWVDNTPAVLAQAISNLANLELAAIGLRGRNWMLSDYSWSARASEMNDLFRELVEMGHES